MPGLQQSSHVPLPILPKLGVDNFRRVPSTAMQKFRRHRNVSICVDSHCRNNRGVVTKIMFLAEGLTYLAQCTHKKCRGIEVTARKIKMTRRFILICQRFRKLGTPMSSQINLPCASSISCRVGAARSCMQTFDIESSIMLRMLMTM